MNRRTIASGFILLSLIGLSARGEAPRAKTGAVISGKNMISTSAAKTSYNAASLHRLDFKVVGKSCATCLLGIQNRITLVPGVVKAAVQLKPPYAATVIYDASKTGKDAIMERAKVSLPDLQTKDMEDEHIAQVPAILIPKIGAGQ
jgi:copper chaperone CopZ